MRRVYQLYDIRWPEEIEPRPVMIGGKGIYITREEKEGQDTKEKAEDDAREYLNLMRHQISGKLDLVYLGEEGKIENLEKAFFIPEALSRR